MEKRFLRSGIFHSMLKDEESTGFPIIGIASQYLMGERNYFSRCLTKFEFGKQEFKRKFIDARTVLFTREEVSNWLYKTKEEAELESDLVFIKYRSSTMDENEIDFERVGYLAGIYFEANRFLKIIIAIESTDKEKAHYSIIDRLNELDQSIIAKDIIPGYYRFQKNLKIQGHEYELRNLDKEWKDYLSYADNHNVGNTFGDIAYLLNDYHSEFKLKLARTKPLSKIKELLNYHIKEFSIGQEIDFINHIQYRIMPELDSFVGSNYIIYCQIIKEWLKEKHFHLSEEDELFLIKSIHNAISTFLDDIYENRKRNDENKYNVVIRDALNHRLSSKQWYVKDQSLGGETDSISLKSKAGIAFRDLIISNSEGRHVSIIECFRLKHNPNLVNENNQIVLHLKKIFRNEPLGVSPLFIIVYCETRTFSKSWNTYLDYIQYIEYKKYKMIDLDRDINIIKAANIKTAKAIHSRELNSINVYHIFINMFP